MQCPNCGGQMGLEDAVCPYCNTPNAQAVKHQADMARYQREYQRTQTDVIAKTSLMQRHGSWLVVLAVLLVALVIGVVLQVYAWDIGYSIRASEVEKSAAADSRVMDEYLAQGDYGKFLGYYVANDITLDSENEYQGVRAAASSYVQLIGYVSDIHMHWDNPYRPDYRSDVCGYIAEDLNRIFTLDQEYPYNTDRYLPADKRVYVEDIQERAAAIAKAYFGLTDETVQEIPNMSTRRLATIIEEGIAS